MGGSPSRCVASLQFPYSSVNFWQGDTQSFFYPALASNAPNGAGSTSYECFGQNSGGNVADYAFQVALIGPGGTSYQCDNLTPNPAQSNEAKTITCPSVSRDSLSAGTYFFQFTTDGQSNNGPSFTITRNNRLQSCVDSIFFPDRQANFNFRTDDPNVAFTTIGYSGYQCSPLADCVRSSNGQTCGNSPFINPASGGSAYDELQSSELPGTSASANPYSSPLTYRADFFNQIRRGTAANGQWSTGIFLYDNPESGNFQSPSYDFTISHNDNDAPVPSQKGFKRRQDVERCPLGYERCLIPGTIMTECLDTRTDLEACGGCPGTTSSVDCTALSDIDSMSCVAGVCVSHAATEDWGLVVQS